MGLPPIAVGALAGALVLAVAVCLLSAAFAWRAAWPVGLRRLANDLNERIAELEIEWRKVKGEIATDLENLEQLEESVERKRARAAATKSWEQRGLQQQQIDPNTANRKQLQQLARSRGYNV